MLRCLSDVENLTEAISALGKADFTGVAALEITGDMKRMRWEVINPWHLCRPSIHAPWMYNANADPVPIAPEMLEAESVILREALPMHLPAMFLIVAKRHGVQAWDAFLDKFGIPAAFFETPPGATEEEAMEFDATVQKLIGEGSGTIPSGAKLHTFETARDNTQTFEARARWCDDALLQLILGGKLTMTTEAGSGTLAGNAHQESFERLCAATARSISECINRQFCRRILREAFPDQPQLALFDLSAQKQEDLTEQAQLIATLSSAGFRPSPETVSEMMGFEVEAVEPTQPATPFSPGLQPITNRETDSTTPDASAPLTEQELAALQSLSKGFAADQLEADANTIYSALADAISPSEDPDPTAENAKHPNGRECEARPGHCPLTKSKTDYPNFRHAREGGSKGQHTAAKSSVKKTQRKDETPTKKHRPVPEQFKGVDMGFLDTDEGDVLLRWREESRSKKNRVWTITDKKNQHIVDAGRYTNERLNRLLPPGDRSTAWTLTTKKTEFHHAIHHDYGELGIALIPDVFNNWDSLDIEPDGRYLFEKTYGKEKYRLVCDIGGKNKLFGGKRQMRLITFHRATDHQRSRVHRKKKKK